MYVYLFLPSHLFIYLTKNYYYYFKEKIDLITNGPNFFIIVLARVFQLYAYVLSNIKRDHSIVIYLENICWFVVFIFWKFSTHQGGEKFVWKMSQYKRAENMTFECIWIDFILIIVDCKNMIWLIWL